MIKDLVSIITPCYNTVKLLHRLLDSILEQDYPLVEMYAINDGSTDDTESVIKSYIDKFAQKGYTLNYIYQENSGQSVAINNGLKLIHGEFLVWPDSDDWYSTSNALSKMVQALKDADDSVSMVRCLAEYVSEDTLEVTNRTQFTDKIDLFEDCLFARIGFWYCAGGYMCRMSDFDKLVREREIYTEKNAGQNWQLMLPLLYERKCLTINEYHYKILERSSSHSRGQYKAYEGQILKLKTYENTIISTLNQMPNIPEEQRRKYVRDVEIKYLIERYYLSFCFSKISEVRTIEKQLQEVYNVCIPLRKRLRLYLSHYLRPVKKFLCYD